MLEIAKRLNQYSKDYYEYSYYNDLATLYNDDENLFIESLVTSLSTNKERILEVLKSDLEDIEKENEYYPVVLKLINEITYLQ